MVEGRGTVTGRWQGRAVATASSRGGDAKFLLEVVEVGEVEPTLPLARDGARDVAPTAFQVFAFSVFPGRLEA